MCGRYQFANWRDEFVDVRNENHIHCHEMALLHNEIWYTRDESDAHRHGMLLLSYVSIGC